MAERQAGTPQGGLWYPGEGTFHWRSQEGLEKVTPAPVWVPWLQSDSMEGKAGSREGARRGSVTRDFYESSHLVTALRISLPQPSSAKGHRPGRFCQVSPSLPDAPRHSALATGVLPPLPPSPPI